LTRSSAFKHKPIPWMYSTLGSMIATAMIKLNPIQRRLTELEIRNIQDYFNSDFISPENRRKISNFSAFLMTYLSAIGRVPQISKLARQDYYALQRQGCFAVREIPSPEEPVYPHSRNLPLLIVPGLNTPAVFFREMHSYFQQKGYNVTVMDMPENGLADVATAAAHLEQEVETLRHKCNTSQINVVGHCLGGLITHYWLETQHSQTAKMAVQNLVSLGTGFLGAEGVQQLKDIWIPRNPGKPVPQVFDELIHWNLNVVKHSRDVAYHSLLTIWDFMVHFRKGLLEASHDASCQINNLILEDPAIDHLTIALNHQVFKRIEEMLDSQMLGNKKLALAHQESA
jgi:pimeloyl-ACP methyl ester carboxylesterase